MTSGTISRGRLLLVMLLLMAAWTGLTWRLVQIQLLDRHEFRKRAEQQHHREVVLEARRGEIVDRHGRLLAVDRLLHTVGVHPRMVQDPDGVADWLVRLVGHDRAHWQQEMAGRRNFFYVARRSELLEDPPPGHRLPVGLEITRSYRRTYPAGAAAGHLLGWVGVDGRGLEGIELTYDALLGGRPGRVVQRVDATGAPIPGLTEMREDPVDGLRLRLTLDAVVQQVLEEELQRGVAEFGARGGMAVAIDPRSGAILAMANAPQLDPNQPEAVPVAQRRNRAVTDLFEPGSVLKIVTFAAALDARRYTIADTIDGGNGVIQVVGAEIRDTRAHGRMSLSEVLQYSSNVGTVKIARAVGENRMYRYARDFGLGQPTGVDLPGEAAGVLRRLPQWQGAALESLSIGYGLSVNALQIASAYAAVANGGRLLRPYVVAAVEDARGRVRRRTGTEVIRRVMHEESAVLLTGFLQQAVEHGTGDLGAVVGLEVAGKTGTARKATASGYAAGAYLSSFVGFAPAGDPRVLLMVALDEPAGRYYAREVAAPIFSRTLQRLLSHPENPLEGTVRAVHRVVEGPDPIVPDLRQWPATEAGRALTRRGLRVRLVGQGATVVAQDPAPFTSVAEGGVVMLHLEGSPPGPDATAERRAPDLRGRTLREAAAQAGVLGLALAVEGSGLVRSQYPPPGGALRGVTEMRVVARLPGGSR